MRRQIGASISGAAGAYVASSLFLEKGAALILNAVIPGIGAFLGFIVGGLIGSLFGGTPRSGADVTYDESEQTFGVTNAWVKKGGSREAAENISQAVANTYNGVLSLTGGALIVANDNGVPNGAAAIQKAA